MGQLFGCVMDMINEEYDVRQFLLAVASDCAGYDDQFAPETLEPDCYYRDQLQVAKEELKEWEQMSEIERTDFVMEKNQKLIDQCERVIAENEAVNAHILKMSDQILKWVPPTPEHEVLKSTAIQYLNASYNDNRYMREIAASAREKQADYLVGQYVVMLKDDIAWFEEQARFEESLHKRNQQWLTQLHESLNHIKTD